MAHPDRSDRQDLDFPTFSYPISNSMHFTVSPPVRLARNVDIAAHGETKG